MKKGYLGIPCFLVSYKDIDKAKLQLCGVLLKAIIPICRSVRVCSSTFARIVSTIEENMQWMVDTVKLACGDGFTMARFLRRAMLTTMIKQFRIRFTAHLLPPP